MEQDAERTSLDDTSVLADTWARRALRPVDGVEGGRALRELAKIRPVIGTFLIEHPSVASIRAMGLAGFDFVIIDLEHSPAGFSEIEALTVAAHACGLAALVRVWGDATGAIGKVLDCGANGVLVPQIELASQAAEVVREARFPPVGVRSFSPITRYQALNQNMAEIDERTLVIVQVEGPGGLAAATDIAQMAGIDGLFVGPYDLAAALGVPVDGAEIAAASRELASSLPTGALLGIYADDATGTADRAAIGFNFQCIGFDGRMLLDAASNAVRDARSSLRSQRPGASQGRSVGDGR